MSDFVRKREGIRSCRKSGALEQHIVEAKKTHFKPEKFEDEYEDALKELLNKKRSGEKFEVPKERPSAKVINLRDALRRSVETERGGAERRPARAGSRRATKPRDIRRAAGTRPRA